MGMILEYTVAIVLVIVAFRSMSWYEPPPKPKQKPK